MRGSCVITLRCGWVWHLALRSEAFFFVESSGPPLSPLVMGETFKGKEEKTSEQKCEGGEKEIAAELGMAQKLRLRLRGNKHKPFLVYT